jgi:hypothetical protein
MSHIVKWLSSTSTTDDDSDEGGNGDGNVDGSDYYPPPCVFLDASTNIDTDPVSTIVNLNGYPLITTESTTTALDDTIQHPMSSRTIPSGDMTGQAFLKYLREKDVRHLAILSMDDQYGHLYVQGMREKMVECSTRNMTLEEFYLKSDGSNLSEVMKGIKILNIGTCI